MPETTPIFAHVENGGWPFCSYGVDTVFIKDLDAPEETVFSALEYVENRVFHEHGDMVVAAVSPESLRDHHPLRVGTLTYDRERIVAVDLDLEQ